jgi:hypothetical protein
MKQLRKNKEGLFVCEECEKTFKICSSLSAHVGLHHNQREYFDNWIKEETESICLNCSAPTSYSARWDRGYSMFCCKKCKNEYGIIESRREKIRKSLKITCQERYGVDAYTQSNDFKQKMFDKYGAENPSQNKDILQKLFKAEKKIKQYKNTNIWYQGTYELDFLDKYYDKYPEIQRGPSIKYNFNGKIRTYHPDFYIPSLNLIIECKNSYLLKRDAIIIKEKEKATIANGFNYVIIVNKDYKKLLSASSSST